MKYQRVTVVGVEYEDIERGSVIGYTDTASLGTILSAEYTQ